MMPQPASSRVKNSSRAESRFCGAQVGVRLSELLTPFPNRFIADHNTALDHHFFDVAIA
jgi:hypothetical protein